MPCFRTHDLPVDQTVVSNVTENLKREYFSNISSSYQRAVVSHDVTGSKEFLLKVPSMAPTDGNSMYIFPWSN
jgi:hypothetical protein